SAPTEATGRGQYPLCAQASRRGATRAAPAAATSAPAPGSARVPVATGYPRTTGATPPCSRALRSLAAPSTRNAPPAPAPVVLSSHQARPDARGGLGQITRRNAAAAAPSPYPIAMVMPETTACNAQCRGNSDGVSDRQKNSVAPTLPPK